jgi:hypothetical protein
MAAEWYKNQPTNRNYLAPVGFQLKFELFNSVDFFCQKANLPGLSMPVTEVPTRFRNFPIVPGGGVTFDDLQVTFIIDEDLKNYYSIHEWIRRNGNSEQHIDGDGEVKYSNGQLMILTSNFNPAFFVDYEKLFPINLTPIQFDSTVGDIEYFTADVTFKFQNYTIRDKNFKPL